MFILALTIFCAVGFLLSTVSSIAESLAHYKGFKWMGTKELLPVRTAIKVGGGILEWAMLIWHAINVIIDWLIESAKRFLPHRERRGALIPMALSGWRTLGAWAIGISSMDIHTSGPDHLELVAHDEERRPVDLRIELKTREEKEKNATNFWYQTRNEEGVHLRMTITHAHLGVVR